MGCVSGTGGVRIPVKVSHAGVNRHRQVSEWPPSFTPLDRLPTSDA